MNKTIYIRDEDVPTWDKAKRLAPDKLAPIIMDGLRRYVIEREKEASGFGRILVEYRDAENRGLPTAKAFHGKWLFTREEPYRVHGTDPFDASPYTRNYAVALTAKGRFAVLDWVETPEGHGNPSFSVFDSLDDVISSNMDRDAKAAIVEKFGVKVEELDI